MSRLVETIRRIEEGVRPAVAFVAESCSSDCKSMRLSVLDGGKESLFSLNDIREAIAFEETFKRRTQKAYVGGLIRRALPKGASQQIRPPSLVRRSFQAAAELTSGRCRSQEMVDATSSDSCEVRPVAVPCPASTDTAPKTEISERRQFVDGGRSKMRVLSESRQRSQVA